MANYHLVYNPDLNIRDKRSIGEQVRSGFRLAGGVLAFCAGLFLLAYGYDAVWQDGHFVSSAWLGWLELSLAAVLIPLTMHLWVQFFAGCIAVGFLKSVWVAVTGQEFYRPHLTFSRVEAAAMALVFGATLVFLIRFARTRPELPDRIAIALYLFFILGLRNNSHFSIAQAGMGLAALFVAWLVSRWRTHDTTTDRCAIRPASLGTAEQK